MVSDELGIYDIIIAGIRCGLTEGKYMKLLRDVPFYCQEWSSRKWREPDPGKR